MTELPILQVNPFPLKKIANKSMIFFLMFFSQGHYMYVNFYCLFVSVVVLWPSQPVKVMWSWAGLDLAKHLTSIPVSAQTFASKLTTISLESMDREERPWKYFMICLHETGWAGTLTHNFRVVVKSTADGTLEKFLLYCDLCYYWF